MIDHRTRDAALEDDDPPLIRRVYLVRMTRPNAPTTRFRAFEVVDGRLKLIWPPDPHARSKAYLLPFQVFSMREGYDAYHFALPARSHESACHKLARALQQRWGCRVEVYDLSEMPRIDMHAITANGKDDQCLTAP